MSKSILVVDDEAELLELLKDYLESQNYKVTTAANGLDATMILNDQDFDLIISDFKMPFMNGLDLAKHLKIVNSEVPIIWLSGQVDQMTYRLGWKEGLFEFAQKPIRVEHLQELIDRALMFGKKIAKERRNLPA